MVFRKLLSVAQPMESNFESDFHKYHEAAVLWGLHGWDIANNSAGFGSSGKEYNLCTAFLIPRSVTGKISGLPRQNIKNISDVHLPIPFTRVNSAITSSSDIVDNSSKFIFPCSTLVERSFRYCTLLLDKPILDFNSMSEVEMICIGFGNTLL
jgi:hypothetical protein